MRTFRAVVTGVSGRMGSLLVKAVRDAPDFELTGGTDRPGNANIGLDVGLAAHMGPLEVTVADSLEKALAAGADVVIDFTTAEASVAHAKICADKKVALVVGSTGFSANDKKAIADCAKATAILMSPNMSLGVNLMIEVAAQMAKRVGADFDIEIVETHHRNKKDAPSGTALRIADEIRSALKRDEKDIKSSRVGQIGERSRTEIGVQTVRGGDVVGEHTVFYLGDGERLELTHRATSRQQFASGAIKAARFLAGKAPGLYDMSHVLKG